MKFTPGERVEILAAAHGTLRRVKAEMRRWAKEDPRRRDGGDRRRDGARYVTKTTGHRVPVTPAPDADAEGKLVLISTADLYPYLDQRIEKTAASILEIAGEAHGRLQREVRERDREIEGLRRELKMLRDEIGLERGLAKLKAEVSQARRQQPSYEGKLSGLQAEVEKLAKQTTRLRSEQAQLQFAQKQLDAAQRKDHREMTLTAVQLTA